MLRVSCIGHIGANAEVKSANGKEFTTFRLQDYHLVSSNFPEKFNYIVNL